MLTWVGAVAAPLSRDMFMLYNLSTNNGLSSNRVYSIVEAPDGAMWIGTKRGVDRYNGRSVKKYTLLSDMPYSSVSGNSFKLVTDSHGIMFAYDCKGSIYKFDIAKDAFVREIDMLEKLRKPLRVNDMSIDSKANFWFALNQGVYLLYANGKGRFILPHIYVNHIFFIGNKLFVGASDGLYVCRRDGTGAKKFLAGCSVLSSYHDKKAHQLWLGTFLNGIHVLDDRTLKPVDHVSLNTTSSLPIRSLLRFDSHTILVGIDGAGVYAYNCNTKTFAPLLNAAGRDGNTLKGNGVYVLCRDRFGDLWVGTYAGGVDRALPMNHAVEYINYEYLNTQSINDNNINAIFESSDGRIWYGTEKGVSIFDPKNRTWRHCLHDKVALTICETPTGQVLVGTYGSAVYSVGSNGCGVQTYSKKNGKLKSDFVYSIFVDAEGGTWFGCLDGDLVHIAANGKTENFPINEIQNITESPDKKNIAIGTTHGCYLIDKRARKVSRFFVPDEFKDRDCNCFANALQFQTNRLLWIGTDGGGVYCYDLLKHAIVSNLTEADALPSNVVTALTEDKGRQRIWVSTDKGLAFIENGKVTNLNFFEGLDRAYNRMAVVKTRSGKMIFGSSNGAVALSPGFTQGLAYKAPLHFTHIQIEGAEESGELNERLFGMMQKGRVNLSHSENTLLVNFESINYQYQEDIQYQYFLEGYDHQWSLPQSNGRVRFANIPPGSYTLHVKSIGRSNGRELGSKTLTIVIAQPWWNTWWAWVVYISMAVGLLYLVWDYYRERLQRKYYDEKINFFVNTAHNIRTPLSLVLAPMANLAKESGMSENGKALLSMAQSNGDKLLRMVTELLDFQKLEQTSGEIHLQNIHLPVMIRSQIDKFKVAAAEKNIALQMETCAEVEFATDLKLMDLIFENLLSNAIKYTEKGGRVTITASCREKHIIINVADTGIGIPQSESKHIFKNFYRASNAVESQEMGSGMGLTLTRQLAERLHGHLTFESVEGEGTVFTLELPFTAADTSKFGNVSDGQGVSLSHDTSSAIQEPDARMETEKDTILFVDDNADLRQYIRIALGGTYNIVEACSGEEALAYLEHSGICDIVVSDVMMPGMSGDELCRAIKRNQDTSWMPVVMLTAKVGKDFQLECLKMGADDYVAKPFDSDILVGKIDSLLKNRRRLSQYYMQRSLAIVNGTETANQEPPATIAQPSSTEQQPAPADQTFVDKATKLVLDNLQDTDFNIDQLCREMAMSRTLFYGKLKTLTGKAPQDFIRLIRLEQAAHYLKQGDTVLDVSVKTGFVNVKYFSTVFKKHYGVSPSQVNR